jgi:hypothetical protein
VSERERIARLCCYWADPVKNGTCHDNFCTTECRAIRPDDQFWQMADAILARPEPSEAVVEAVRHAIDQLDAMICGDDEYHKVYPSPDAVAERLRAAIAAYEAERGK